MKLKKVMILLISCLLLLSIGIGIEDIYCAYFHSGSGDFRMLEVGAYGGVLIINPMEEDSFNPEELTDWAKENEKALIIVGDSPGLAVCDGSGSVKALLEKAGVSASAPSLDAGMTGVYITNDAAYVSAYVKDDIFILGELTLPVLGYYDVSMLPEDIQRPFLYPLSMMNQKGMFYLTDAQDGDAMNALIHLLRKIHPDSEITDHNSRLNILQFLSLLLHDPVASRSRTTEFVTIIALLLCYLFSGFMLFREHRRELSIRHLFGMSLNRIRLSFAFMFGTVIVLSSLLFLGSTWETGYSQLALSEKFLITGVLLLISAAATIIVNLIGMAGIRKIFSGGMRYENDRSRME